MRSTMTLVSSSLIGLVSLLVGAGAAAQPSPTDVQKRLVGNWRLISFVNIDEKGAERPAAYDAGRIMYDAHGNMAAQLSRSGRPKLSPKPSEADRAAAYSGFLAYYGRYTVDAATGRVTHHVEGSTNPSWPGTELVRYYAFSPDDSRLMLSLKNAEGRITGTLTWERLR